jgi:hypothetical protein
MGSKREYDQATEGLREKSERRVGEPPSGSSEVMNVVVPADWEVEPDVERQQHSG